MTNDREDKKPDRDAILEWLLWAETMTSQAGRDTYPPRRLINALRALDEGRADAILAPAKRSNSTKSKHERAVDVLIIAAVDALINIGTSRENAIKKVAEIADVKPGKIVNLRKKLSSNGEKYKAHKPDYEALAEKFITFGLTDRGLPPPDEKMILNNLRLNLSLRQGNRR